MEELSLEGERPEALARLSPVVEFGLLDWFGRIEGIGNSSMTVMVSESDLQYQ